MGSLDRDHALDVDPRCTQHPGNSIDGLRRNTSILGLDVAHHVHQAGSRPAALVSGVNGRPIANFTVDRVLAVACEEADSLLVVGRD